MTDIGHKWPTNNKNQKNKRVRRTHHDASLNTPTLPSPASEGG